MGELLFLDSRILERIFSFLSYKDLSNLSLSCKGLDERITEFLRHFVLTLRRKCEELNNYPQVCHCWEKELWEELKNPSSSVCNLVFYKYEDLFQGIYHRKSVSEADDFPHLGGRYAYIRAITDKHLQRSIVHLNSVCWLYCSLHFKGIHPGRYKPSIVLRLCQESFDYPSYDYRDAPDIFVQVKSLDDSAEVFSEGRIPVKDLQKWVQTSERAQYAFLEEIPLCNSCPSRVDSKREAHNDLWFYYHLPDFNLAKTTDLDFVFHDIQNKLWKSGIEWDFFQLKKNRLI